MWTVIHMESWFKWSYLFLEAYLCKSHWHIIRVSVLLWSDLREIGHWHSTLMKKILVDPGPIALFGLIYLTGLVWNWGRRNYVFHQFGWRMGEKCTRQISRSNRGLYSQNRLVASWKGSVLVALRLYRAWSKCNATYAWEPALALSSCQLYL